jgi:hypothetical protein
VHDADPDTGDGRGRLLVSRIARWSSLVYLAAVAFFVAEVFWHALSAHYTVPNRDDWRILDDLFSTGALDWIFTDQNGHWIPGTLALLLLDYTWFGGQMHVLAVASVFCVAVGIAVVVRLFAPEGGRSDPSTLATVGLAVFLLAWGAARHDLVWGANQGTLMAAMWTLLSFSTLCRWLEQRRTAGAATRPRLLVVAMLAATAATFSQGIGFSSFAGLLVMAVAARASLLLVASLVAYAGAVLLLYRVGIEPVMSTSMRAYGVLAAADPLALGEAALAFVGSPLGAILAACGLVRDVTRYETALLCGFVALAGLALVALFTRARPEAPTARQLFAIGLATTAVAGGLMVALNRVFLPETAIHVRFATWSSLFFVGLVAAVPGRTARPRGGWVQLATVVACVSVSGLALPALERERGLQADRRDRLAVLNAMHVLGIRWDRESGGTLLGASADRTYRVLARLRRDGKSIFGTPLAALPGSRLDARATLADENRCSGAVTSTSDIRSRDGGALAVSGFARDQRRDAPVEQVVVTNRDGVIVGLGVPVRAGAAFPAASLPAEDFPWTGYVAGASARAYTAFGLVDGGRVACSLGAVLRRDRRRG